MRKTLVAVLFAATCTACVGEELACPQPINVTESLIGPAPMGWVTRSTGTQRFLAGVSFFDGDPSKDFNLAPDSDKPAAAERVATWVFGKSPDPIWLVCRYLDTGVVLQKPLTKGLTRCQVRYKAGNVVTSVKCE